MSWLSGLFRRHRDVTHADNAESGTPSQKLKTDATKTSAKEVMVADVTETLGKRKRVTLRVPAQLYNTMNEACKKNGLTFNEGSILLYQWLGSQVLEFEVVRRVRKRKQAVKD